MRPARPVVVLLLEVFFAAFLADFLVVFYPEPLIFEFLYSGFKFAILELCTLGCFIDFIVLVPQLSNVSLS